MTSWLVLLLLIAALAAVLATGREFFDADAGVNAAVSHGWRAAKGAYPWYCAVECRADGRWQHLGAGCLVAPDVVATAAHVVVEAMDFAKRGYELRMAVGRWHRKQSDGVELRKISRGYVYDLNMPTSSDIQSGRKKLSDLTHDVGTFVLRRPSTHLPVSLAAKGFEPTGPWKIIGLGLMRDPDRTTTRLARPVMLQKSWVHPAKCDTRLIGIPNMLCVKNKDTMATACAGDSGGPLFCTDKNGKDTVFGICSMADKGCDAPLKGKKTVSASFFKDARAYEGFFKLAVFYRATAGVPFKG